MRKIVTAMIILAVNSGGSLQAQEDFESRVLKVVLENPEVILLAIEALREKESQQKASATRAKIDAHGSELFSQPSTKLVKFLDYRCGYCAQSLDTVEQLSEKEQSAIRYLELPILGRESVEIAEVALGVRNTAGEDDYRIFQKSVFDSGGRVSGRETALSLAASLGHDREVIAEASTSSEVQHEIRETRHLARSLGISGTPAFVSRDRIHEGLMPLLEISEIVNSKETSE